MAFLRLQLPHPGAASVHKITQNKKRLDGLGISLDRLPEGSFGLCLFLLGKVKLPSCRWSMTLFGSRAIALWENSSAFANCCWLA